MSTKVVVFDLGKVIFDFDLLKFIVNYAKKTPVHKAADFKKLILEYSDLAASYEKGTISSLEFYESLSGHTHYSGSYNEFCAIWNNIFEPLSETISLFPGLLKKYHLAILSNTNELHFEYLKNKYPQIFSHFGKIFLSYEMKMRKPDDEIFRKVIEYYKVLPEEIFFIDDIEANVKAAENNGLKAHRFTSSKDLAKKLKTERII